ncbi:hypothetical protein CERSUDRAFT_74310 [Gelatoporia subvermispora B]|uniref:Putative ER transporter 6TM N-terminal domain-containing protein n=1 Tax=Ceriporiopsis subvermispora (strain B) TaxID=914234 RepID=M2RBX0_CERS8|nr:hypothetical protein CERSUDRAFT_74310 [Gelatoporia subvermispora B]
MASSGSIDRETAAESTRDPEKTQREDASGTPAGHGVTPGASPGSTPGLMKAFLDKLPPWIATNLRSRRSLKLWARCWLASWVCFVLLLPNKSVTQLGNAAFFALLGSFMAPPNVPLQIYIFILSTLVVGLCLGWGIGSAAMRAALAARNQDLLREQLLKTEQSAAGLANVDALFQASIFEGNFLDARSSVVFGCFLGASAFGFALIRAYAPKLIILSVFATISMDVFCVGDHQFTDVPYLSSGFPQSYGPLFPFGEYTIILSLVESLACYVGIGLILITFLFPETLNHAYLLGISSLLDNLKGMIEMQDEVLNARPEDLALGTPLMTKMMGSRAAVVGRIQQVTSPLTFINFEFSWGKWSGQDIKKLSEPLLAVIAPVGKSYFAKMVGHPYLQTGESSVISLPSTSESTVEDATPMFGDTHLLRHYRKYYHDAEAAHHVRIVDVLPTIRSATLDLRTACASCLGALKSVIDAVNTKRYARDNVEVTDVALSALRQQAAALDAALEAFKTSQRQALVQPFESLLQRAEKERDVPLRSLYISYCFAAMLIVVGDAVNGLAKAVLALAERRTRNRLWWPQGLRHVGQVLMQRSSSGEQALGEDGVPDDGGQETREEKSYMLISTWCRAGSRQPAADQLHAAYSEPYSQRVSVEQNSGSTSAFLEDLHVS